MPKDNKSVRHVRYIVNKALSSGSSTLNYAKMGYKFLRGEIKTSYHVLQSVNMSTIDLDATINLLEQTLSGLFTYTATAAGAKGAYPVKVNMSGTLANPIKVWDEKAIVRRWESGRF